MLQNCREGKRTLVGCEGFGWFKLLLPRVENDSKCSKGAGSQPSATPFDGFLAWVKMLIGVRKTN